MTDHSKIYDLGVVDGDVGEGVIPAPTSFRQGPPNEDGQGKAVPARRARRWSPGWDLTGSLSLFVPGAGQIAQRDSRRGAFYLFTMAFLAVLAWAGINTVERLAGTMDLFGYPRSLIVYGLLSIYAVAAIVHLGSVLTAYEMSAAPHAYHPVVTGLASAVVPGWGQILNNARLRCTIFLGILWFIGGAWLLISTASVDFLASLGLMLPRWAENDAVPMATWLALGVTWSVAVYDAASSAVSRRRVK